MLDGSIFNAPDYSDDEPDEGSGAPGTSEDLDEAEQLRRELRQWATLTGMGPAEIEEAVERFKAKQASEEETSGDGGTGSRDSGISPSGRQ